MHKRHRLGEKEEEINPKNQNETNTNNYGHTSYIILTKQQLIASSRAILLFYDLINDLRSVWIWTSFD